MDEDAAMRAMAMPTRPIEFVAAQAGETFLLPGKMVCRVMEDGSNTDNRLSSVEITVPAHTAGPPAHWHEMHDETFLVTAGTVRFHAPGGKTIDAKTGDYVVVPPRAPHTFENATDQEAKFFNTFTPAFYLNFLKLLSILSAGGQRPSKDKVLDAMARFATLPADEM